MAITKQSIDLGKKLLTLDQSPSMGVLSTAANKGIGKIKATNLETNQKQQAKQQVEERPLKKAPNTLSALHTSRQQPSSGFTSPKEPSSAIVKSVASVDSGLNKKQTLVSPNNKK